MKKNLFSTLLALLTIGAMLTCVGCKNYDDDISDINKKLSTAQSDITTLQGQVKTLETTVSTMESTLTSVQTQLKNCAEKSQITSLEDAQAKLKSAIDECKATIADSKAALEKKIDDAATLAAQTYATIAALNDANAAITDLQSKVATLTGDVAALKAAAEEAHTAISATISNIQTQIDDIKAQLENYYTKDQVQALINDLKDSLFTVTALASEVWAGYDIYRWHGPGSTAQENYLKLIGEVYPEVLTYQKNQELVYMNGLPFIASPADKDLSKASFALVDVEGNEYPAAFSVEEGICDGEWEEDWSDIYTTKSTSNASAWTAKLTSRLYLPDGTYLGDGKTAEHLALVVDEGTNVAGTLFAYSVTATDKTGWMQFGIEQSNTSCYFDESGIDLFSKNFFTPSTGASGYLISKQDGSADIMYKIFAVADAVQADRYGIKVNSGRYLTMSTKPELKDQPVKLKAYAVGPNGVAACCDVNLTVFDTPQVITKTLSDVTVQLSISADNQKFSWNVSELGMTLSELDYFIKAFNGKDFAVVSSDGESVYGPYSLTLKFDNTDAAKAKTFGFDVPRGVAVPGTCANVATYTDGTATSAVLNFNATVKNPEAEQIKLLDALCDANGVLHVIGTPESDGQIWYPLWEAFVTADKGLTKVTSATFEDVEWSKISYKENEAPSWIDPSVPEKTKEYGSTESQNLVVPVWNYGTTVPSGSNYPFQKEQKLLNTERVIKVTYDAFGNSGNKRSFEFKAVVESPIYTEETALVSAIDQNIYFDKSDGKPNSFTIDKIQGNAIYVAGPNIAQKYNYIMTWKANDPVYEYFYAYDTDMYSNDQMQWFKYDENGDFVEMRDSSEPYATSENNNNISGNRTAQYVYDNEGNKHTVSEQGDRWMLDEEGDLIELDVEDKDLLKGFGFSETKAALIAEFAKPGNYFVTQSMVENSYKVWTQYYKNQNAEEKKDVKTATAEEKLAIDAYDEIKDYFKFKYNLYSANSWTKNYNVSAYIDSCKVIFEDYEYAQQFVKFSGTYWEPQESGEVSGDALYLKYMETVYYNPVLTVTGNANLNDNSTITSVTLPATLNIWDKWGRTTQRSFNVIVSVNPDAKSEK